MSATSIYRTVRRRLQRLVTLGRTPFLRWRAGLLLPTLLTAPVLADYTNRVAEAAGENASARPSPWRRRAIPSRRPTPKQRGSWRGHALIWRTWRPTMSNGSRLPAKASRFPGNWWRACPG